MKRAIAVLTGAAAVALFASGCTEIDQSDKTKKVYAGKKDERPYDGKTFGDDKAKWQQALAERNKGQNEYLRTEPAKK